MSCSVIRELKETTMTAARTSPNKSFNEQNNSCARALKIFVHLFAVLCMQDREMTKFCVVWGPVHTNPFSNENGAVLLRFQKDLRPHLSFSYRFRPSTLQRRICFKSAFIPQCACSNDLDACAFQYIGSRNWRHSWYSRSSGLARGRVYFDDVTVFR